MREILLLALVPTVAFAQEPAKRWKDTGKFRFTNAKTTSPDSRELSRKQIRTWIHPRRWSLSRALRDNESKEPHEDGSSRGFFVHAGRHGQGRADKGAESVANR